MFKFVVPSPRAGFGHTRRRDDDEGRPEEERSDALLNYLNKQKDKDLRPYKSKGALETTKLQRIVSATKTKNVVKSEENDGARNPQHTATIKRVAGEKASIRGEDLPNGSLTEGRVQSRSRRTCSCASYGKEKPCYLPRGRGSARPRSADNEIAAIRYRKGVEMTYDRYSVSDSDGGSNSRLDQPSPILLTALPPQNALKVPATRLTDSPFTNGWKYNSSSECVNREVDENSNCVETTGGHSSREPRNIVREASGVYWLSSRNNVRFTNSVVERPNIVQERLFPQEPHSFQSITQGYCAKLSPTSLRGSQVPTSGQLFLDEPLFATDDGCEEDYYENGSDEEITKEVPGTERKITEALYSISNHDGPLCYPNGGKTFDNYIGSSGVKNVEKIFGNSRYYDRSKYEDVISDQDAEVYNNNEKFSWNIEAEHYVPFPDHKRKQRPSEHFRQKAKDYFTMSKNGFGNSNTKPRLKRSGENRGRKLRSSDKDDDDDVTTLTMVTNSDQEELNSSPSESESSTHESIENSLRSNSLRQFLKEQVPVNPVAIERVERFSVTSSEVNVFNGVYSPEQRRSFLQRSISTQSGKLRDRLNAVTDDEGCLYDVTPRGSGRCLHAYDLYSKEHNSGSELDMSLTSHPSSAEISPSQFSHARVGQLKADEALGRSRTSRSLTGLPIRKGSPAQARRCRSLDRGLRSTFTSALSPAHSDTTGQRSFVNFPQRGSLGSDSELILSSSLSRRQRQPKAPSSRSLVDRYKPKIDVAESLSALILNPLKGRENDRETLNKNLKRSSWNISKEEVVYSAEDLRLGSTRRNYISSPAVFRRSYQSIPGSCCGGLTHCKRLDVDCQEDSVFSKSSIGSRPRESKIISKSQTPNRYPAVASSPRSITSLLPSPRRDTNSEPEVIAIIDNDVPANEIAEYEQVGRRNSFLEAVTGNSSLSGHSNNSELSGYGEDVEQAFSRLAKSVESRNSTLKNAEYQSQTIEHSNSANLAEVHPDEVNVNLTTDPISNDLTVAVIRRPSTRSQSTSSEPASPIVKHGRSNHISEFFHQNDPAQSRPSAMHGSIEPSYYVNVLSNSNHPNSGLSEIVAVKCRNPHCRKEMCLADAKPKFKSCHHCYTYYCSQQCRLSHWERHKIKCVFARVNSDCKKILRMGRDEDIVRQAFTRVARTGYLSRGRGCVQVIFSCPEKAERFIAEGLFALESLPLFRTVQELSELKARLVENSDLITNGLIETCKTVYDAEKSYVLQVLIDIPDETFAKYERPYRHQNSHGVYLHTTNPVFRYQQDVNSPPALQNTNTPETLILSPPTIIPETRLTSSPICSTYLTPPPVNAVSSSAMHSNALPCADAARDAKRARQLCFISIQRKLREKGVTLRHQYPEVYRELCAYVDTGARFTPVVIYPQDTRTRTHFMCLVMPESEPQILGWVKTPGLLDDIATG